MGQSPPIPVDPIQTVPDTVLRQTPGQTHDNLAQLQAPQQPSAHSQAQPPQQSTQGQAPPPLQQANQQFQPAPPSNHFMPPAGNYPSGQHAPPSQSQYQQHVGPEHPLGQASLPGGGFPVGMQTMHDSRGGQLPGQVPTNHETRPGPMPQQTPSAHQSRKTGTQRAQSLSVPARSPAADSYLDRIEHDAKLQSMISGRPPVTGSSINTSTDKPLPDPRGRSKKTLSRRQSLMDDLHDHRAPGHIKSGDRYPSFPVNGTGHSRQTSFNSNARHGQTQDL